MRPGWNPLRRNQKIGVPRAIGGADNKMVIPEGFLFNGPLSRFEREIGGTKITVLVEECPESYVHAVSVEDVFAMLELIPHADWDGLGMFVLKYPTRKQDMLNSCWGRLVYDMTLDDYGGAVVFLYANNLKPFRWQKSLTPRLVKEVERLNVDGLIVREEKRHYVVEPTLEAVRNRILFRTLPHEVGHWVHFIEQVDDPGRGNEEERTRLWELFCTITRHDREDFADRYAEQLRAKLIAEKKIPFSPKSA